MTGWTVKVHDGTALQTVAVVKVHDGTALQTVAAVEATTV